MNLKIGSVVEGHGECLAVPVLLRRIASEVDPTAAIEIVPPFRKQRSSLLKPGELEKAVEAVALRARPRGGVVVLIDSDDDCPRTLAPDLLARATRASIGLPVSVILPHREFECWFLAAASSLGGRRGLPSDLETPHNPEDVRGAKAWLQSRMSGRAYSETLDQPAFAGLMDIQKARASRSFDKCYREVARLLKHFREV